MQPRSLRGSLWFAALLIGLPACAKAQYVVVDARGAGDIRAGTLLAAEQMIVVPDQGWLRVLGRDVKPVLLKGPLRGRAGALIGKAGPARVELSLLEHLAMVLTQPFVVRGPANQDGDYLPIDMLTSGHQCALDTPVLLRRPHSAGVAMVELTATASGQRASLRWEAEQATRPWPAAVDLVDGAQYEAEVTSLVRNGGLRRNSVQFTLTVKPDTGARDSAAALSAFLQAGCNSQVLRLVHGLESGSVK